jgi:hypothetical protein
VPPPAGTSVGGGAVLVLMSDEPTESPVLTRKLRGRLGRAVIEAWPVSLSITFPMVPSMSARAEGAEARSILGALPMILTGLLLYLCSMISSSSSSATSQVLRAVEPRHGNGRWSGLGLEARHERDGRPAGFRRPPPKHSRQWPQ